MSHQRTLHTNTKLPRSDIQHDASPTHDVFSSLIAERDALKQQVSEQTTSVATLLKRMHQKSLATSSLPTDLIRQHEHISTENARLRNENTKLREQLRALNGEKATLHNENDAHKNKLKGANKKVRNAKEVAGHESEKAREAVKNKKQHVDAERRMREERNEALKEVQAERKKVQILKEKLSVERSGKPHARDTACENADVVIAVVPTEFEMRREDFRELKAYLELKQRILRDEFKEIYEEWKNPTSNGDDAEDGAQGGVVGAVYVDDDEDRKKRNKLYGGMVKMPEGHLETDAEHDGRRSKRGLQAVCRNAEAKHKS